MKAHIGDHIVVEGTHIGDQRRIGVITEIEHADGSPPYRVRWLNDGHSTLIFPGPESRIEPGQEA
ncbi:DUF1918 domain-containing protein [Actinoplanes sp. NPDC023714]|uniref:DUF1918 domain-containing protein n=1 Tax=Actinoplanes sp. NPDC023714 TaxID=3154322 RepID=UPI00340F8F90